MSQPPLPLVGLDASPTCDFDLRRVRFVEQVDPSVAIDSRTSVLMTFTDPSLRYAVCSSISIQDEHSPESMEVMILPLDSTSGNSLAPEGLNSWLGSVDMVSMQPRVMVKSRSAEVTWRPGRVLLRCERDQINPLLLALVEFHYFEKELRKIESEIEASWSDLNQDRRLAFQVTDHDLNQSESLRNRMEQTLERRMRHVRIEPHLYLPGIQLSVAAQKLGEELREKTRIEARCESVDSQIEVFEHVYEMASQRLGEFRDARYGHKLEWIIILLLAAEFVWLIAEFLMNLEY